VGQKVSPYVLRIGINKTWRSLWFAGRKDYAKNVKEDFEIRKFIMKRFLQAAVSHVIIERLAEQVRIKIASARPGVIVGRRGADIDRLKEELSHITSREIAVDIIEIKVPALDAQLVAQNIAFQLEKRVAFRRAVKRAIEQSIQSGALGIKVSVSGRLGGAEMCRRETYREGSIPLQTLRADVDYGFFEAHTTYGVLGIKAWIYKGEIIREKQRSKESKLKVAPDVKEIK
jgi:small subunit ribosomal protein S3